MPRSLSIGLLCIAIGLPASAQDKKDPPKKKEKISIADPEKAKADPDFAIQGEYVGEATAAQPKLAAQVVAKGDGQFDVKLFTGGLPGEGWDGMTPLKAVAKRGEDGLVAISEKGQTTGSIADGKLKINAANSRVTELSRVERKSPTLGPKPPEGAIVLFGGPGDETNWNGGKILELSDGKFLKMGATSKKNYGNFKIHVEFRTPWMPNSFGQSRGNSGVILQRLYEIQVLESFGLEGKDNECGGIYSLHKPLVNMCLPPLVWQTYDIDFTAAHLDSDQKLKLARVTVLHNGVKIQDDMEVKRPTAGGDQPQKPTPGPIQLQDHGNPVAYNNIWLVEVK